MDKADYLVSAERLPSWFEYPSELISLVDSGRVNLTPWHILEAIYAYPEIEALRDRYQRNLVPFAYRQDNDDLACIEKEAKGKVLIIHNHASKGFEDEGSFETFASWLEAAESEMESW